MVRPWDRSRRYDTLGCGRMVRHGDIARDSALDPAWTQPLRLLLPGLALRSADCPLCRHGRVEAHATAWHSQNMDPQPFRSTVLDSAMLLAVLAGSV